MATRLEQHGDVVLEVPVGPRESNTVRLQKRTPACRALALLQALIGLAAVCLWKLEVLFEARFPIYAGLALALMALSFVTDHWGVTEEVWRRPPTSAARAAYRRREIAQNILHVGVLAAFLGLVFWEPDNRVTWWLALAALIVAAHVLGWWTKRTHGRFLERVLDRREPQGPA